MHYTGKRAQDVLNYFYKNATVYLDRKYKKYELALQWVKKQECNKWTKVAQEKLLIDYPFKGYKIPELLKHYSKNGIRNKARRMGVKYIG